MCARENTNSWGVGINFIKNVETASQYGADFGQGLGGEVSYQFISNSRIQVRVRLEISSIREGSGGFAQQDQMETSSPAGPISWNYWSKGTIETLSCDWLFKLNRIYGPYCLLGTGIDSVQEQRRVLTHIPSVSGDSQNTWSFGKQNLFGNFIPTVGVGWSLANRTEFEIRLAVDRVWFGDRFVPQTEPGYGSLFLSSFVVRRRF